MQARGPSLLAGHEPGGLEDVAVQRAVELVAAVRADIQRVEAESPLAVSVGFFAQLGRAALPLLSNR